MRRKGFTLVEVVICTAILAITTLGVVAVSTRISIMKTDARNQAYLGLHNLNVMESIRQMAYDMPAGEQLLSYYGLEATATMTTDLGINTEVFVESTNFNTFTVYRIRVDSRMKAYKQSMRSVYTFTDIGKPRSSYVNGGVLD